MKITSVSRYKGNTFCVEAEGHENMYLGEETVLCFNIKAGAEIPESAVSDIKRTDLSRKAKERAMYLLTVRDHCFVELYNKLARNYPHEISLDTCRKMAELGLVNDGEYAAKLARELFEARHFGYYRVRQEMKRRGLTESAVEAAMEPYKDSEGSYERLRELVERKYARYLTDEKGEKKVKAALARAGYRYDEINSVVGLYRGE